MSLPIRLLAMASVGATAATGLLATAEGGAPASVVASQPAAPEARDDRVARIGFALATTNAALCGQPSRPIGLRLHTLDSYAAAHRPAISLRNGLGNGFGVLGVVPGSPAAAAGVRGGDEIIGVDTVDATRFRLDARRASASHDRVTAFLDLLDDKAKDGTVALRWQRNGAEMAAILSVPPGCPARFVAIASRDADAWTDGRHIAITTTLVDLLDDDELAFALGHELAHVVLGHAARTPGALTAIGIGAGRIRDEENAADALGVRLAARAGFSAEAAERFLAKLAAARGTDHSFTHPASEHRIAAVRAIARQLDPAGVPR